MPGQARSYSNYYEDKEDREEMKETIVPRGNTRTINKNTKKSKIAKDALRRRLAKMNPTAERLL